MWFDLLRHANSVDDEWIQKPTKDELNFNEAITLLCTFGLVDPDRSSQQEVGARRYSVHSCVHSWIVFVLNKEWDKSHARLALTCVASEVPDTNEKHWWLSQRRLLQHATRQAFFIVDAKVRTILGVSQARQPLHSPRQAGRGRGDVSSSAARL